MKAVFPNENISDFDKNTKYTILWVFFWNWNLWKIKICCFPENTDF